MKQAETAKSKTPKAATSASPPKKLYRLPKSGKIAGVCAGLADYLEIDVTVMRLIFVVLTLASGGFGIIVYIILAIVMPVSEAEVGAHISGKNVGENIQTLAEEVKSGGGVDRLRNYAGAALVVFGAWLLLVQLFPGWIELNWGVVWAALLVLCGLLLIVRGRN